MLEEFSYLRNKQNEMILLKSCQTLKTNIHLSTEKIEPYYKLSQPNIIKITVLIFE